MHYGRQWRGVPLEVDESTKTRGWSAYTRSASANEIEEAEHCYKLAANLTCRLFWRARILELRGEVKL